MSRYTFRRAEKHEVPAVFDLIMARVRWMDDVGIRQWNVTDYAGCYPLSHYEAARQRGDLFVLTDEAGIAACAVLRQDDERWPEAMQAAEPAFYLHHLATRLGAKGAGRIFLQMAEAHAATQGKTRFRLDSADDNAFLADYYTAQGYVPVGTCVDGLYTGILREKALLELIVPGKASDEEIWAFREDYISAGEGADTLGSLALCDSVGEWRDRIAPFLDAATTPAGKVPTRYYLYRRADGKIVGLAQVRYLLNDYYARFAGHVGYTICPSERRKGYACSLLHRSIQLCRDSGIGDVLVCCSPDNEGSKRTILHCGGVLDAAETDPKYNLPINRYKFLKE